MLQQIVLALFAILMLLTMFICFMAVLARANDTTPSTDAMSSREDALRNAEAAAEEGGVARLAMPE